MTEHFVLKEDGKIYWIEKMPHDLMWQNASFDYNTALQLAIDNAVEVSNWEDVLRALAHENEWDDWYRCEDGVQGYMTIGSVYSLQCSVEKQCCAKGFPFHCDKGNCIHQRAIVSFQPPVEEGEKQEGKFAKMFRESSLFKEVSKEGEKETQAQLWEEVFSNYPVADWLFAKEYVQEMINKYTLTRKP